MAAVAPVLAPNAINSQEVLDAITGAPHPAPGFLCEDLSGITSWPRKDDHPTCDQNDTCWLHLINPHDNLELWQSLRAMAPAVGATDAERGQVRKSMYQLCIRVGRGHMGAGNRVPVKLCCMLWIQHLAGASQMGYLDH